MKTNRLLKDIMRHSGLSEASFADLLDLDIKVLKLYEHESLTVSEKLIDEVLEKLHLSRASVEHNFSIGDNLRYARKVLNVSVSDLAKSVRMKPCEIYAIEDDAKPVSLLELDEIAMSLNVALSEILTGNFEDGLPREHSMYQIKCVLPETLNLFRKRKEYTIRELANYLKVSESRMDSFLRGILPTPQELIRLSNLLGVEMSDLTYDGDVTFRIVPRKVKHLCRDFKVFAKNLKYLIDKYDYGVPDYLECYLGFNCGVIRDYLTGKVGVPDYTINKIAEYYGICPKSLRNVDITAQ